MLMAPSRLAMLVYIALLPHLAWSLSARGVQSIITESKISGASPHAPKPHEARASHVVIVPEFKLLICAIPKNACTQFESLTRAVSGLNSTFLEEAIPHANLKHLLDDPAWTKAVFLRDPLDRLVSGYRSKCEPPQEGLGLNCMNFQTANKHHWPTFDKFATKLYRCRNPHFDAQTSFCSLDTHYHKYNFVGMITKDHQQVSRRVKKIFRQAMDRTHHNADWKRKDVAEKCLKYFPSEGPAKGHPDHYHNDTDVRHMYTQKRTLDAALQRYIVDYDKLNLRPPTWVSEASMSRARRSAAEVAAAFGDADPLDHFCYNDK